MSNVTLLILSFTIMLVEHLILLLFWSGFAKLRKNKITTWLTLVGLLFCLSLFTNLAIKNNYLQIATVMIIVYIVMRLFYVGHWYVLLFSVFGGIVFLKGIDNVVIYLAAMMLEVTTESLILNQYHFFLLAFLSKTVELFLAWAIKNWTQRHFVNGTTRWQSWIQTLPLPLATCFLMVISVSISFSSPESAPLLLQLTLVFLALCFLQFFVAKKLDKQKQSEEENKRLGHALALRKENIKSLTEAFSVQRKLTHDYNNLINVILTLLHKKQYKELEEYVNSLYGKVESVAVVVNTHNAVIDAVLNQKYSMAVDKKIAVDFDLSDLSKIPLPDEEIAIVFSNLLDNAIEACAACTQERLIRIKTRITNNKMLLMVNNTTVKEPIVRNGQFKTTKSDEPLHGHGLSNVKNILDEFHAEYTFKYQDGEFTFIAVIPASAPI